MRFNTLELLTTITGLLAVSTSANPLAFSEGETAFDLTKRACPAECGPGGPPLARKVGAPCNGGCDTTYSAGSETCSCNLGAIN
ncbi:MAG: hypothetical protein Q9182_001574 [Xanthomendoza sp. 2 TL-2023]